MPGGNAYLKQVSLRSTSLRPAARAGTNPARGHGMDMLSRGRAKLRPFWLNHILL